MESGLKKRSSFMKRTLALLIFAIVFSLFYGVVASGQILGFAGLYTVFLAVPLSIGLAILVFVFYRRYGNQFFDSFLRARDASGNIWLTTAFTIGASLLFALLVFFPLVHWPFSPISSQLNWDAGLYHFPKAAEMIATGSAWDLSISYGEYPFGFESLIAMALLINHAGFLIGTMHALIALFLFLVIGLLIYQKTKLPQAPIFLVIGLIFLGYQLARNFDSNIWWIFWPQVTLIGKNDVFLAAALLAVILHTPTSSKGPFFPFGLGMASMLAISIKPNAALVILFAWAAMLFFLWRSGQWKAYWKQLVLGILVILPGGLWGIRNLVAQGMLFSPAALHISSWSIASNLTNPFFYKYIPQHLYFVIAIIFIAAVVSIFKRSLRFEVIVAMVLLATFALTPATAFSGSTQERAQIEWRFAVALLAYILLLVMAALEPLILPVYRWIARKNFLAIPLATIILGLACWCVWTQRDLMATYPKNAIVLHDQYTHPVGVDGYYSAYDYVHKNVHDSVVIIENGLPYYLYDAGFTNSVTRSRPADYIVFLKTAWINTGGYPGTLKQPDWAQTWQLVYEDKQGRVYQRK
jgi:hypothetical protein